MFSFSQQHLLKRLPFPHYVAVTSLSKLFGRLCKSLYLGSLYPILFVCVSVFFFFCQNHIIFITVAMQYVLKSGNVKPPSLFFFKMALTIWDELKLIFVHREVPCYYLHKAHFSTFFFSKEEKVNTKIPSLVTLILNSYFLCLNVLGNWSNPKVATINASSMLSCEHSQCQECWTHLILKTHRWSNTAWCALHSGPNHFGSNCNKLLILCH